MSISVEFSEKELELAITSIGNSAERIAFQPPRRGTLPNGSWGFLPDPPLSERKMKVVKQMGELVYKLVKSRKS
jgi:hypothetical protein